MAKQDPLQSCRPPWPGTDLAALRPDSHKQRTLRRGALAIAQGQRVRRDSAGVHISEGRVLTFCAAEHQPSEGSPSRVGPVLASGTKLREWCWRSGGSDTTPTATTTGPGATSTTFRRSTGRNSPLARWEDPRFLGETPDELRWMSQRWSIMLSSDGPFGRGTMTEVHQHLADEAGAPSSALEMGVD